MDSKSFFSKEEQKQITDAIVAAELNTSGEIRVHLDNKCSGDPIEKAIEIFANLNMHLTEQNNGVLFYFAVSDRKFAIIGDKGINDLVPSDFWDEIKTTIIEAFKSKQYALGLSKGIAMAGEKLKLHFPYQSDDVNELPDEISFED
jgi:uncharacterized membrane protein